MHQTITISTHKYQRSRYLQLQVIGQGRTFRCTLSFYSVAILFKVPLLLSRMRCKSPLPFSIISLWSMKCWQRTVIWIHPPLVLNIVSCQSIEVEQECWLDTLTTTSPDGDETIILSWTLSGSLRTTSTDGDETNHLTWSLSSISAMISIDTSRDELVSREGHLKMRWALGLASSKCKHANLFA